MTTLVASPTFLDTNILVYASITQAPLHTADFNRFANHITIIPLT